MQRYTVKAVSDDVEQCIKSVSCTVLLPSDSLVDLEQCSEPCGWTAFGTMWVDCESCGWTVFGIMWADYESCGL